MQGDAFYDAESASEDEATNEEGVSPSCVRQRPQALPSRGGAVAAKRQGAAVAAKKLFDIFERPPARAIAAAGPTRAPLRPAKSPRAPL